MGQLLDGINTGLGIARAQQAKRADEEAKKLREAEALALKDYRRTLVDNMARDDARAQTAAVAAAEDRRANIQRMSQADINLSSDRAAMADDRATALKDKSAAAQEKTAKAQKTAEFYARFGRNMSPAQLADMQAADPGWQGPLQNTPKMGVIDAAVDAMAAVPEGVDPQVIERMITAQSVGRSNEEFARDPEIMERDGYKFYRTRNGPVLIPGANQSLRDGSMERDTSIGSKTTTTRWIPNAKPEPPATPEQTAALAEIYARRSATPPVVAPPMNRQQNVVPKPKPQTQAPNPANNRQANAGKVKSGDDDEKVEVVNPQGKRKLIRKSQLDQALKQNPPYTLPK